jgi:hypothetical protein
MLLLVCGPRVSQSNQIYILRTLPMRGGCTGAATPFSALSEAKQGDPLVM